MNLLKIQAVLENQKDILQSLLAERTCTRSEESLVRLDSKLWAEVEEGEG